MDCDFERATEVSTSSADTARLRNGTTTHPHLERQEDMGRPAPNDCRLAKPLLREERQSDSTRSHQRLTSMNATQVLSGTLCVAAGVAHGENALLVPRHAPPEQSCHSACGHHVSCGNESARRKLTLNAVDEPGVPDPTALSTLSCPFWFHTASITARRGKGLTAPPPTDKQKVQSWAVELA